LCWFGGRDGYRLRGAGEVGAPQPDRGDGGDEHQGYSSALCGSFWSRVEGFFFSRQGIGAALGLVDEVAMDVVPVVFGSASGTSGR
jgi:hypothetical protein